MTAPHPDGITVPRWVCNDPQKTTVMSEIINAGLDLAKNVFQAHGADASRRTVLRKKLRRDQVLAFFEVLPSCVEAMEADSGQRDVRALFSVEACGIGTLPQITHQTHARIMFFSRTSDPMARFPDS